MVTPTPPDLPLSASQRRVLPLDTILHGDCLEVLRGLPDASVDAIVTDPPYGLGAAPDMLEVLCAWLGGEAYTPRGSGGFMGKAWDAFVPGPEYWRECLRVLKPGGHALVFAGTRTWDVMGLALRLAGFEIRDTIGSHGGASFPALAWIQGQGFPKSADISKQIDKAAGAQRTKIGPRVYAGGHVQNNSGIAAHNYGGGKWGHEGASLTIEETAPATDAARAWDGWGTALKPAWEPVIVCRKPLAAATVAGNVLAYGTGALNIGASRVESGRDYHGLTVTQGVNTARTSWEHRRQPRTFAPAAGRWPPNLLLSHSIWCTADACAEGCPVRVLGEQSGVSPRGGKPRSQGRASSAVNYGIHARPEYDPYPDTVQGNSTAARFFPQFRPSPDDAPPFRYVAKASRRERNAGCEGLPQKRSVDSDWIAENRKDAPSGGATSPQSNHHPTVKPLALMSWLITLITPPGGVVLDPFAGSGSTLCAAKAGGWRYIGIEREAEYVAICEARLAATERPGSLGSAVMMEQPKPARVKPPTTKKPRRKPVKPAVTPLWESAV